MQTLVGLGGLNICSDIFKLFKRGLAVNPKECSFRERICFDEMEWQFPLYKFASCCVENTTGTHTMKFAGQKTSVGRVRPSRTAKNSVRPGLDNARGETEGTRFGWIVNLIINYLEVLRCASLSPCSALRMVEEELDTHIFHPFFLGRGRNLNSKWSFCNCKDGI